MKLSEAQRLAKQAAVAHTNLTMFAAIVALCESGCFPGADGHAAQQSIISTCKRQIDRFLVKYECALAGLALLKGDEHG